MAHHHAAGARARRRSTPPGSWEEASFRVRTALWEDGVDVGSPDAVTALAAELGVQTTATDHRSVIDDWADGQRRGVDGSPHYFCGGADLFSADTDRVEAFLEECWT